MAASAAALNEEFAARHRALDDGLARLRAPLDDPALLHAKPIPELSVELTPLVTAPASPEPESFAIDDEDDDDDEYADDESVAFVDDEYDEEDDFDDVDDAYDERWGARQRVE